MKTNWIILVSSLAFPIKMEIIFAGGEREQELTIITVGESSAMKNDFFSPLLPKS